MVMNNQDHDDEVVGWVLRTGTWRDWIPKLPRLVFAFGKMDIYSVFLNGRDFVLQIRGHEDPIIGFYTTRFVAAENFHSAEKAACRSVLQEWEQKAYLKECGKDPKLSVEKVVILSERFRLRSGAGFTFYGSNNSE